MPSPQQLSDIRKQVRTLITEFTQQQMTEDELAERVQRLSAENGPSVLNILLTITFDGMAELQRTVPGARMGGIAGHLQATISRLGEPYASLVHALTKVIRLNLHEAPDTAQQAMEAAWRRWGSATTDVGTRMVVVLYGEIASARGGISLAQAWAEAAARDEQETEEYLAAPLTVAEQRLWDAGFNEQDFQTIRTRLTSVRIGTQEFGHDSTSFADLATTPERRSALLTWFEAIKDAR